MAKSKYETHVAPYLDKVREWTEAGATLEEIAGNLHLAPSTLHLYLKKAAEGDERYSEFSEALTRAREIPDDQVEAALFKLATGYTVPLKKTFKVKRVEFDERGHKIAEYEELVQGIDETHVPANAQAQMFWLTNRRPDRWRYKPAEEKSDEEDDTGVVELAPVMDDPGPPRPPDQEGGEADA